MKLKHARRILGFCNMREGSTKHNHQLFHMRRVCSFSISFNALGTDKSENKEEINVEQFETFLAIVDKFLMSCFRSKK